MIRFLRGYILSNAWLKLVALAVSFLLWTTYTTEPPAEMGFLVPLEYTNMPDQLEISGITPTAVQVRVRGPSVLLRRMVPFDLNARVDLNGAKAEGTPLQVMPKISGVPFGATVVGIGPSEIHVTLVPRRGPPTPVD
jgi:hypothetical protein